MTLIRLSTLALAAALSLMVPPALAQEERDQTKECTVETCKAGTRALTYFRKDDPYYICPTRELATYVAWVVGMAQITITLGGEMPNIDDKTGEFESGGETKEMLDMLRAKAGVTTFDQAMAICAKGGDGRHVSILNMPVGATSMVAYVEDERMKRNYWMPIVSLDKELPTVPHRD